MRRQGPHETGEAARPGARDAGAVINGVIKDVFSFANGAEQADDITILAFKLVGKVV